jgi:hypothetical protein
MDRRRSSYKPHWRARIPLENADVVKPRVPATRYSRALIEETKEVWQPYYEETLTDEDAREIIENMIGFLHFVADHGDADDPGNRAPRVTDRKIP